MEYCNGGSLTNFLEENGYLFEYQAQFWFKQIVNGLAVLHSHQIMHRDMKPDNILLSDTNDFKAMLKIVDFGLSKKVELL